MICYLHKTGQSALNERLKLVIKSGKWVIGYGDALKSIRQVSGQRMNKTKQNKTIVGCARINKTMNFNFLVFFLNHFYFWLVLCFFFVTTQQNKCKLLIMANNTPGLKRSQMEYYCMLGRVPVIHYDGANTDLGRACGKLYAGSVLSVMDAGDSDLIKVIEDKRNEKKAKRMKMAAAPTN